jgi:trk system potassium uptake protein TrkH
MVQGLVVPMGGAAFAVAAGYGETGMMKSFALLAAAAAVLSLPAFIAMRRPPFSTSPREGLSAVFLTWVFISILGAIPFYFGIGLGFADALFESTCAFATTGGTVMADIEALPRSLLFWRSIAHWAGGMGIIVLTVALIPLLGGTGGFQLIKAETPGPDKEKITPKLAETAKTLYLVYGALTALLFLLYLAGGMPVFDAVCHAFTVMATGGVSTKNAGLAFYQSPFIEWVTIIFMLLAAINFNLYFRLLKGRLRAIADNTELKAFLLIALVAAALVFLGLRSVYENAATAIRHAVFQVVSILSTSGAAIADYEQWPDAAQMVLFILFFIGGCSTSTAGGIKVIRIVVLFKQTANEVRRLISPRGIFSVQLNKKIGRKDVVYGTAGFVFLYLLTVFVTAIISTAAGIDVYSSFSAALAITGNVGIGFGAAGPAHNYAAFPAAIKALYSLVMIAGRLELMTAFVLFTREYRIR